MVISCLSMRVGADAIPISTNNYIYYTIVVKDALYKNMIYTAIIIYHYSAVIIVLTYQRSEPRTEGEKESSLIGNNKK